MTISNVSGAAPSTFASITGGGLSPESLMLYCSTQLNSLDDQITAQMNQQNKARDTQSKLNELKTSYLNGNLAGADSGARAQIMNQTKDLYDSLPPNDPMRGQLQGLFENTVSSTCLNDDFPTKISLDTVTHDQINNDYSKRGGEKNTISDGEKKGWCESIDGMLNDVSKGAELKMINLQSMISQRQMAVQLATSMMTKVNETVGAILNNIK